MELVLKSSPRLVSLYSFLETLYQSFRLIIGRGVMGRASDMLNSICIRKLPKSFRSKLRPTVGHNLIRKSHACKCADVNHMSGQR